MLEQRLLELIIDAQYAVRTTVACCDCMVVRYGQQVVCYRRHAKHMDLLQRITTVHNLSKLCFVQKERPSGHLEESTVSGFERPRPELGLSDRSTADESLHDAYSTALFWVS